VRFLCAVLLCAVLACTSEPSLKPTQITLRLYASPSVQAQTLELRVRLANLEGERFVESFRGYFPRNKLRWPMDIPVLPDAKTAHNGKFEVIVEALGESRRVLVDARVITSFVPGQQKLLELVLAPCGERALYEPCELDAECHGFECSTCDHRARWLVRARAGCSE
jgi:hypothetical protein